MSDESLQAARELHRKGRFGEAIAAYGSYLEGDPARGDVWHLKAMAEHQSGRLDERGKA
jgi:hypothetical protein